MGVGTICVLQHYNVSFGAADVLSDPELREGIKEFSKWPTIPQVRAPPKSREGEFEFEWSSRPQVVWVR